MGDNRGGVSSRVTRLAVAAGFLASTMAWPNSAHAAVVTDRIISESRQTQTNVPVTFGQVFKSGDVPRGTALIATLDGHPVSLQVDAKATNPDGSLRHAILTAVLSSLPARAKLPIALSSQAVAPAKAEPLALSQLLATGYDAKVSLNIGGTSYTASARKLLEAASTTHACKAWDKICNVWLSGPLASEWVVNGPVTASNGASPNLRVYFAVRAYSSGTLGTVGRVRTDIIVENSDAFAPQTQPQYTATLTSGTASFTSPALTQYTATRWHKMLWWNNDEPQVYLQQDTQYIQDSKAVSRYMPLTPDESFLASLRQSCAPLDRCDQTQHMGNAGAQPAIGPLPRWASVYIIDPDVRAYNWMLANTDALGAYSIHYRDAATGWPVSIQKHPYVTMADWAYASGVAQQNSTKGAQYKADLLPNCVNNSVVTNCGTSWYSTGNLNKWDNAHQPAESYVPYMVTGDYYYMSELAFGASNNQIWSNEAYRGYSQGLIDGSHGQVRGKAWALREMANAAWLLPDSYPLKAEFKAAVENSLADWNAKYTNNSQANPLALMNGGAVYSVNGGKNNAMAPWQHNFLTWSAGHAAELGFAGAAEFRNWLARFEIGLMTDWQSNPTQGFCWLEAAAYNIQVKDASGNWLPSYTAVYATNWPSLVGLACNSPAMLTQLSLLRKKTTQAGEMSGYPYAATGFPSNFQIGLAAAADSGLPNAQIAWSIFDSRSVKPSGSTSYNNYPNFAVIPRSSLAGVQPPPTMPSSLDPPSTSTPPTTSTPPPTSNPPLVTITPPPVPKELPARKCAATACGSTAQPGVSKAEPVRAIESTPPPRTLVNTTTSGSARASTVATVTAASSAVQGPTRPVRILVRVLCTRFEAWCDRNLPQRLYVPAQESVRPQAAADAPARMQLPGAASQVAPGLTPTFSVTRAPVQGATGHILRR